MVKKLLLPVLLTLLVILASGCVEESGEQKEEVKQIDVNLEASLDRSTIISGESTVLNVRGINSGDEVINAVFQIVPDVLDKVTVEYSGASENYLLAGEDTGTKKYNITAFSDAKSTTYELEVKMTDQLTSKMVASETVSLTVFKE